MGKLLLIGFVIFVGWRISENPDRFWDKVDQGNQLADEMVYHVERGIENFEDFVSFDGDSDTGPQGTYHVVLVRAGQYKYLGKARGLNACYNMAASASRGKDFKYDCCTYFDGNRCKSAP